MSVSPTAIPAMGPRREKWIINKKFSKIFKDNNVGLHEEIDKKKQKRKTPLRDQIKFKKNKKIYISSFGTFCLTNVYCIFGISEPFLRVFFLSFS